MKNNSFEFSKITPKQMELDTDELQEAEGQKELVN